MRKLFGTPFKVTCVVLIIIIQTGHISAQKIKYKDLFYLLDQKKFDEAEPVLKQFIADPKNLDHPNANYQMALLYKHKSEKADIFQEAQQVWIFIDSSEYYFLKAKELLDEREVEKKNSEYYEEFVKRDTRTGKSSVKAFDVHFAIDEYLDNIKQRQLSVAEVNDKLLQVINQYNNSRRYFIDFKKDNNDINEMLLRANLKTIGALDHLADTYDSFQINFTQMIEMLKGIPNSGYSQQIRPQPIRDFMNDGETESHFLDDDIEIWNYAEWAKKTRAVAISEILPLKSQLIQHDESLEDLLEKAESDSLVFTGVYQELKSKFDDAVLLKYDRDPLPLKLFALRYAELDYFNSFLQHLDFKNSSDYSLRISLLEKDRKLLHKMDSIVNTIVRLDIDRQIRNYTDYIDYRFKGYLGLDKFLKEKIELVKKYDQSLETDLRALKERNSYVLVEERKFYIDTSYYTKSDSLNYIPKVTRQTFSSGLIYDNNKTSGYWVEVNPQRQSNYFYTFNIDSVHLGKDPGLVANMDGSGQIFYLLYYGDSTHTKVDIGSLKEEIVSDSLAVASNTEDGAGEGTNDGSQMDVAKTFKVVYPAILCKLYKVDGVAWKVPLQLSNIPSGIRLNDIGEILIDEQAETETREGRKIVLDNRDGTVKSSDYPKNK